MKILAIDSASDVCSVALLDNDNLIDEINLENGRTHSENLMPLVDEIIKRNNMDIKDIELLGCTVGPGSFTGIRIGVASIKPIAEVLNIKVASVTSLEVLSKNVDDESNRVCLIDARNNQVYFGAFDKDSNLIMEYAADDINAILDQIKLDNITFVGNGAELHKDLIKEKFPNAKFSDNNKQSAKNVGFMTYKKYLENKLENADTIIPIYLRKSQAERLKK